MCPRTLSDRHDQTETDRALSFLDAISSQGIHDYMIYRSLRPTQSESHLLGQVLRPFRKSKDVKKGNIAIMAIKAIMAITASMAIAAITAITDIKALVLTEPIVVITTTTANGKMYIITAIKPIETIMTITATAIITVIVVITDIWAITASTGQLQSIQLLLPIEE